MYSQRQSGGRGFNHVVCGRGGCGGRGDYNNNHRIQQTSGKNKDDYDECTSQYQKSYSPEGKPIADHH